MNRVKDHIVIGLETDLNTDDPYPLAAAPTREQALSAALHRVLKLIAMSEEDSYYISHGQLVTGNCTKEMADAIEEKLSAQLIKEADEEFRP